MSNVFYVYEHWRPDKGVCFYVGKGKGDRALCLERIENKHYMAIVSKLTRLGLSPKVRFVAKSLSEDDAFDLERSTIAFWRLIGVSLANITDGGEGVSGLVHSEESKVKMRGKRGNFSAETCTRMSITALKIGADPKIRRQRSEIAKRIGADPEIKAIRSQLAKSNPNYKQNLLEINKLCTKEIRSAATKKARAENPEAFFSPGAGWKDPTIKARYLEKRRQTLKANETLERKAARSKIRKEAGNRPEVKAKFRSSAKKRFEKPGAKEKHSQDLKAAWARKRVLQIAEELI